MKQLLTAFFLVCFIASSSFAQLNVSFISQVSYPQSLNDVWGYVAPDGTEYAMACVQNGVSIVSLADPANPVEVAFLNGVSSGWRDIKTWDEYAYVTNETGNGLMVIDMTDLPNGATSFDWTPNFPSLGTLNDCHNIFIDEFGVAYLAGCNVNGGGLLMIDVFTEPGTPVFIGAGAPVYSHDVYVRDNIAYSSEINAGRMGIYDVTDKTNAVLLATQDTPGGTAHNAWLSDDSSVLFTTDETANGAVAAYDISDLSNIVELDQYRPLETLGDGVIPHNVHVWEDWLIVSYYTDGCILVDGSNPSNLIEVGNFDTFIPDATGFQGAWGAYPFLPSGLILISDIGDGLFILEPNYVRACWLEGSVKDASSGAGLSGATVNILTDNAFGTSDLAGAYGTGLATAGTYDVVASKPGYQPVTVTVELENDVVTMADFELEPLPSFTFTGKVIDALSGDPINEAIVKLANTDFTYDVTTDAAGNFSIPSFFAGAYDIIAGQWNYKTVILNSQDFDENNNSTTVELERGIEDIFSLDLGWSIEGDANSGQFEIGNPIGIAPPQTGGVLIQPEDDVAEDIGNSCYITGNIADVFAGIQTAGTIRIISPIFDMTGMQEPHISYYTWMFNLNIAQALPVPGDDILQVRLTNGSDVVILENINDFTALDQTLWTASEFNLTDVIELTSTMRIIFELKDQDDPNNPVDVAEVGVDFFQAWDANPSSVRNIVEEAFQMSAAPNPTSSEFALNYKVEDWNGTANVVVYNILGQAIEMIDLEQPEGVLSLGSGFDKGVYFIQIQQADKLSSSLKLVKQ